MRRFNSGNRIELLRNGAEYFPALEAEIAAAKHNVYLECYIFAADATGARIADALCAAARRGVDTHVMVDGWGAKKFLTRALVERMTEAGVQFQRYRPSVSPWHFRPRRLRRLHRKLTSIDDRVAFIGGINIIDDMNTPRQKPPRIDFAVRVEGPVVSAVSQTMRQLWALIYFARMLEGGDDLFPPAPPAVRAGNQSAKLVIRDNLRYRHEIEQAYLTAIHAARSEILIANAYFLPGVRFRRALVAAAERGVRVTLLLQGRVEYALLRYASHALYGQLLHAGIDIREHHRGFLHAKVAVIDARWATVGSSNIDPFSLLMSREANIVVRNPVFAEELRRDILELIDAGSRRVAAGDWRSRPPWKKAGVWIMYWLARVLMGVMGYGSETKVRTGE